MTKTHFSWLGSPDQITLEKVIWSEFFRSFSQWSFRSRSCSFALFLPITQSHNLLNQEYSLSITSVLPTYLFWQHWTALSITISLRWAAYLHQFPNAALSRRVKMIDLINYKKSAVPAHFTYHKNWFFAQKIDHFRHDRERERRSESDSPCLKII